MQKIVSNIEKKILDLKKNHLMLVWKNHLFWEGRTPGAFLFENEKVNFVADILLNILSKGGFFFTLCERHFLSVLELL